MIASLAGSHRFIADYLVDEVLEKQTLEVQEFLLKTAVLDQLSATLCDEVTGRDDRQANLLRLDQANLFLVPLDLERRWYRYHHLFADLLRIKLGRAYPGLAAAILARIIANINQHTIGVRIGCFFGGVLFAFMGHAPKNQLEQPDLCPWKAGFNYIG